MYTHTTKQLLVELKNAHAIIHNYINSMTHDQRISCGYPQNIKKIIVRNEKPQAFNTSLGSLNLGPEGRDRSNVNISMC